MIGVNIDKQAIANILKRINPEYAEEAMQATIKSMATYGYGLAKQYLKPEIASRSTDYAPKSMRYEVKPLEARVYSVMPENRARSIEDGRSFGEYVPIKAIYRWFDGTLYVRNTDIHRLKGEERATLYRIQGNIRRSGARGKHFISKTWDKLISDIVPNRLEHIAKQMEKRWRG